MPERSTRIADWASAALMSEAHGSRIARIAELSLEMLGALGKCPTYTGAMTEALALEPPPFDTAPYDTLYRDSAKDTQWMATSLITNSEREGDGSRRLWSLAAFADDGEREQLKQHAVDESKHSLMYLSMLDLVFPSSVLPEFRRELRQLSPGFSMHQTLTPVPGSPYAKEPTMDDFLQMNIAEIRTTIHHVLQRQALGLHCPPQNREALKSIQDCLLRDELAHVGYTAVIIERRARDLDRRKVVGLFVRRFHNFNQITLEELGDNAFDCSLACCAKRDWCRAKAGSTQMAFHAS